MGSRIALILGSCAVAGVAAWVLWREFPGPVESDDGAGDDVSAAGTLVDAWERGRMIGQIAVREVDGVLMEVTLAASWERMRDAAAADGVRLRPTSGFRTMEEQQRLWAEHEAGTRLTPVAEPGRSNHQHGRALDIAVHASDESAEYLWLASNARAFGFRNVGASFSSPEWWHWEFFGDSGGVA